MNKISKEAQFLLACKDPFFFIKQMWGLVPQPCYPEFKQDLINTEPEKWKAEWFGIKLEDGRWDWMEFEKGRHITWQQAAIVEGVRRAVFDYANQPNQITVKTGNGIGKSCITGMLIPWFLFTNVGAIVPCTAPTASQMSDVLWSEVAMWIGRMPKVYSDIFEVTSNYIKIISPMPITGEPHPKWYARARTARRENPEAFSGIHADSVMAIADEASGVPDEIYKAGEGIATSVFWLFLMFSNPTRITGYFYDSFDKLDSNGVIKSKSDWRQFSFDSRESPVVDWKFVEKKMDSSGFDSDNFGTYVRGEFPREDAVDSQGYVPLFNQAELEMAQVEEGAVKYDRQGIDPAGEGHDKSAFVVRSNELAKIVAEEAKSNPKSVAARGNTIIAHYDMDPENTVVDNFGEGANVAVEMAKVGNDVYPVNVGKPASDPKKYMNMRAELIWNMRTWIKQGGQLVRDDRWAELLNLRYRYNESGKLQIMGKAKMKKDGIESPNFADAFMLTFAVNEINIEEPQDTEDPGDVFD